ncbi:hypothetical protein [Nibribacter koreensis]|uniref:Uncharacterized protein n=1 Tax=Nibribacter koreensis TaxID=1084519 RepID=A0ABP8FPH3_9BACT
MMKARLSIFIMYLFMNLLTCTQIQGQAMGAQSQGKAIYQDEDTEEAIASDETDADFSPGLLFFLLLGIGIVLACIGAGIVLTVISLFIVFGLITVGVLSTSVMVGLYHKSLAKGFKTFVVLFSGASGVVICAIALGIINAIAHWWTTLFAIMMGAGLGLVAGLIFGYLAHYTLKRLSTMFMDKLRLRDKVAVENLA